ncbi:hypothetical protein OSB04_017868 [Centaurea solstitialis]|uniref:non-specific serine/threonine protein kinase n=1 Tax=Centaurea solstitialis TaxID=347529 RepID=A0AA38TNN8_9ASTR|nr:hypothetical protein OSB04_017868 [Centaurea solstitialis]
MILLPSITFFFLMVVGTCTSLDTISIYQNITDGETIVSESGLYELGFFSPMISKNRYLGIWFKNTSSHIAVWVANRETPLTNTLGIVKLDSQGVLSLVNSSGTVFWSSNSSTTNIVNNPVAQLLDTGNLVIKDGSVVRDETFIWQSFDYPGDIIISGMKLGKNLVTGREMYLTSWRGLDDPSPGEYTVRYSIAKGEYPQVYLKRSSVIKTRFGQYNDISFARQPPAEVDMVSNEWEMYFIYTFNRTGFLSLLIATPRGDIETWQLNLRTRQWLQMDFTLPKDDCDKYALCGPYGSCSTETSPNCGCLKGFEVSNPEEWRVGNRTGGCRRSTALDCGTGEGFHKFSGMKLPDTQSGNAVFVANISLQECQLACKNNCSCIAYANPNFTQGGVGCLQWFGDLIDIRTYQQNGQDLFVRLAASEFLVRAVKVFIKDHHSSSKEEGIEVPLFSLSTISRATDKFSINNKLGEGGFGAVYKFTLKTIRTNGNIEGVLEEGQEIAVKRLSKSSRQGLDEFKNEVICIAKLQHRNLVKLLGYCIEGEETMLIYEYMPNKSLDRFGVLVLEIVSGKKNRGFVHKDHHDHLLGYAWRLYKEGKSLDLIDTSLGKSWSGSEVLRSIHIALLCVQQRPEDRPNIRSVVRMLGSEGSLPSPQEPGYFVQGSEV